MVSRALKRRTADAAAVVVTGPVAFLISGLIDLALALPVALRYARRSTIKR
jgi:hypothetical protein